MICKRPVVSMMTTSRVGWSQGQRAEHGMATGSRGCPGRDSVVQFLVEDSVVVRIKLRHRRRLRYHGAGFRLGISALASLAVAFVVVLLSGGRRR